jgi:hypothetical protein
MKKLLLNSILLLCALVVGTSSSWAEPITLFHESFGDNSGSARDWDYSYSVKSGVSSVYSGITGYTVSNAKQGKNTTGSTKSGLNQSTQGTDAYIIIGPLNVASYSSLVLTYQWKAASIKGTYSTSLYYKTSAGGDFAEVSGTGTGATVFVERSYSLPAAAQVSTLYLKIVWNTSNTQAIIDEVDLAGTESGGGGSSAPSISLSSLSVNAAEAGANGTINVTYSNIASVDSEVKYYESNGTTETTYDWITASINASNNLAYTISANTGVARTAYMKVHQKNTEVYSGLITISQAAKTVVAPTFNPEGGDYIQGTKISLTSAGNTIYYNITTNGSTPSDPTISSTQYSGPIALSSGTNKIKAIAVDTYGNVSSAVSRTFTGIAPTSLPFSWTGTSSAGKEQLAAITGVKVNLGSNYADSNAPYRLRFDGVGKYVFVYFNEKPEAVSFTAKIFTAASTGSILTVQGSADGINFTDVESFTIKGSANDTFVFTTTNAFDTNDRVIKLTMTSKDQNVGVGCINVTSNRAEPAEPVAAGETVTLTTTANMAGWRTFAPVKDDQNYTVDGTTKVYYASATADGKVTLTEIADGVPANTPVILHQTSGTTITLTETATSISAPGSNLLQVSTASQDLGTVYRLGYKSAYGVGFYTYTTNSAPAGIIYLSSVSTARDYLEFTFDDETTGVDDVRNKMSDGRSEYFNLAGQRVAQPTKGLYIVNGKKYVIK